MKKKVSTMKAAFDENNYNNFLSDLISGGVPLDDFTQPVKFKKVDQWDGKDAPKIEEVRLILLIFILRNHCLMSCDYLFL